MRSLYAVCLLIWAHASSSQAALTVTGTRFVYAADARALTVRISNGGEAPILAQSWLDRGQINQDPSCLSVPFVVSSPLLRLDPGQRSALEVRYTGEALPADRESLFWLNFLEVPPQPPSSTHLLRLSYRLRMKLLFRPAGLLGSAEEAGRQLTWRAHRKALEACNKAPFLSRSRRCTWNREPLTAPRLHHLPVRISPDRGVGDTHFYPLPICCRQGRNDRCTGADSP